jgi:nitroreductase
MNEILQFLQHRNSAPRLTDPGPSPDQLAQMLKAGLRAPDHAWLRPWRFIQIEGDRRTDFGGLLAQCLQLRNPDADEAALLKARNAPLRAPLVLVTVVSLSEHPKVPLVEQRLSAGCAAQGVLLAAEALDFAGVWRTGDAAFDRAVMDGLGLSADEEIIGFLYLGSRDGKPKPIPELDPIDYVSTW